MTKWVDVQFSQGPIEGDVEEMERQAKYVNGFADIEVSDNYFCYGFEELQDAFDFMKVVEEKLQERVVFTYDF